VGKSQRPDSHRRHRNTTARIPTTSMMTRTKTKTKRTKTGTTCSNPKKITAPSRMLLHIGRELGLELAHQRSQAGHDDDRIEQRP
jgi:hypothetical protein